MQFLAVGSQARALTLAAAPGAESAPAPGEPFSPEARHPAGPPGARVPPPHPQDGWLLSSLRLGRVVDRLEREQRNRAPWRLVGDPVEGGSRHWTPFLELTSLHADSLLSRPTARNSPVRLLSAFSFLVASPLAPVRPTFVPLGHGLNVGTADIWGPPVLCCRGCPELCRMLGSLPTLYPLEALITPLLSDDGEKCLQILNASCPLGGNSGPPPLKTTALDLSSIPHPPSPPNSMLIVITLH